MVSTSVDLTNRSQAYSMRCKLTKGSQEGHSCEIILWVHCEVAERFQNELAVSFHVIMQCVSCELKFFTGYCLQIQWIKRQRLHGYLIVLHASFIQISWKRIQDYMIRVVPQNLFPHRLPRQKRPSLIVFAELTGEPMANTTASLIGTWLRLNKCSSEICIHDKHSRRVCFVLG